MTVNKKTKHMSMAAVLTTAVLGDLATGGALSHIASLASLMINLVWLMEDVA